MRTRILVPIVVTVALLAVGLWCGIVDLPRHRAVARESDTRLRNLDAEVRAGIMNALDTDGEPADNHSGTEVFDATGFTEEDGHPAFRQTVSFADGGRYEADLVGEEPGPQRFGSRPHDERLVEGPVADLLVGEADVAIRLTNAPPETLIGKRVATVSSAIYASPEYIEQLRRDDSEPQWLGVECCGFHRSWTQQACGDQTHRFVVDDTLLTQAALREGMGVSILPCFMGDPDPRLARYTDPQPEWDLGLWILLHSDLKRTARVLAFRDHMMKAIKAESDLFAGRHPRRN